MHASNCLMSTTSEEKMPMEPDELRILFAGNPAIAVPSLESLHTNFFVVGVLTNPDRLAGRGRTSEPPPVKLAAQHLKVPVLQYEKLGKEARDAVSLLSPNILVSFAWGGYFGPKFLSLFPYGAINIHPSLLPRHRGSAPIQYAILHGDSQTGVTIQRIAKEVDSGALLASERIQLTGTETAESLSNALAPIAARLIVDTIHNLCAGTISEIVQDESKATYCPLLTKEDGVIDWREPSYVIHRKVRAFYPWPKAVTSYQGQQLAITGVYGTASETAHDVASTSAQPGTVVGLDKTKGLAIACGDGLLFVDRLQLAHKREMDSISFLNGHPDMIGSVLGK